MFASICGRLCPAPCERACVFYEDGAPISIRGLERFASDFGQIKVTKSSYPTPRGKKVAVAGSGPAGLTVAAILAQKGYQVTVFESLNEVGGILRYGIPEFRFPKKVLDAEIAWLKSLGVNFKTNFLVGPSMKVSDFLTSGFSAVFLATGAGTVKFLDIPGTSLGGVMYADEFLMRLQLFSSADPRTRAANQIGYQVVVLGRGYAALDAARAARRMNRQVTVLFAHSEDDFGVRVEEKEYSKEENIQLEPLVKPLEILADENDFARGVKCLRLDFADPTNSGQWQLVEVPDSEFIVDADSVILANGHTPSTALLCQAENDLKINQDGSVWVGESDFMTSLKGVFAEGNVVTGPNSIVQTIAASQKVAVAMDLYLRK